MIYCTVGKARSGKSYITKLLQQSNSYPVIEVSDLVKQFAGKGASRKELQLEKDKHTNNPNWLYDSISSAVRIAIRDRNNSDCIVSGIREVHLLDKLKEEFGPILIYAAMIPDGERWERITKIDKKSMQEIAEDDRRDSDLGIDEIIYKYAHYHVKTDNRVLPTKWSELDIVRKISRVQELQIMFNDFDKKQYPGNNSELMALGVAEEVGELCHHILKRKQGLGNREDHDAGIKDALADIAVFSLQLASCEHIDWEDNFVKVSEEVLKRVRAKVEERYRQTKGK